VRDVVAVPFAALALVSLAPLASLACTTTGTGTGTPSRRPATPPNPSPISGAEPQPTLDPQSLFAIDDTPDPSPSAAAAAAIAHAAPPCGHDAWSTYAHDAARTSASDGCVVPPLRTAWTFAPPLRPGREARAAHALLDADAAYVQGVAGKSPMLWRVDARSGQLAWTFDSRADVPLVTWPTLAPRTVLMVDDGVFFVDPARGTNRGKELDAWGQSLADGDRVIVCNTWQTDGWGPYLAAFDLDGQTLWKKDKLGDARGYAPPDVSGIALGGGVVVTGANRYPNGQHVAAYDARTGEKRWWIETTTPESAPSIAGGRVFLVERRIGDKTDRLVARSLDDGGVAWSREMLGARGAAPVQAGPLVIVHGETGVVAVDRATGEPAWSAPLPRTAAPVQSATTLAAATGSSTLVVVAGGVVHVLRLADGTEMGSFEPAPGAKQVDSPVVQGTSLLVVADGRLVSIASRGSAAPETGSVAGVTSAP
jgi:outer membrane protein assembly factor BamB